MADYTTEHLSAAFNILLQLGPNTYKFLQLREFKGINYPPMFELLVDMLYDHVRHCIQKHVDGVSRFSTGQFALYKSSYHLSHTMQVCCLLSIWT